MDVEVEARFPPKLSPLFEPHRYKVSPGGRGSGRSWGYARALILLAAESKQRILCTREVQNSIKDSVYTLLCDQITALGLGHAYDIRANGIMGVNGSEFLFAGLHDQTVESIKSYEGIDKVWVEEARSATKRSWSILIPTIRKDNSEIWVSFNPELDTDDTYQRFVVNPPPGAVVIPMTYRDNPWFPEVLERERLHCLATDPENYANIWEGACRQAVSGAIYVKEIEAMHAQGRLRPVPYDPLLTVHTIWDLGWNDQAAIICAQKVSSEVRIIDYIEDSHRTVSSYVQELRERTEWRWGHDYIPHDGAAKNMATGVSVEDVLRKLGRKPWVMKATDVEAGIKAARQMFSRVYFDIDKAQALVGHLKRYRRIVNSKTQEAGAPLHDEHSHGADAFRKMAEVVDRMANDTADRRKPIVYPQMGVV